MRGRKAIVSAASKGLGRACARSLAAEGVDLTLNARSAEPLALAAEAIRREFGVTVTEVAADYNEQAGRTAILAACPEPDILVGNPGVRQVPTPFAEIDAAAWRHWLEVHYLSSIEMVQAVAPGMKDRGFGRIVAMSVSFIKFPQVGFAHSHAARLALSGAMAAAARELMPFNVTVNTVCPGLFDTDALRTNLHGHARARQHHLRGDRGGPAQGLPRGAVCRSGRVRRLVAFLCSAQAGFITGQNIVNDGGVHQGLF